MHDMNVCDVEYTLVVYILGWHIFDGKPSQRRKKKHASLVLPIWSPTIVLDKLDAT